MYIVLLILLYGPILITGETSPEEMKEEKFYPLSPKVFCSFLPDEFIECQDPVDHRGNKTARDELGKKNKIIIFEELK